MTCCLTVLIRQHPANALARLGWKLEFRGISFAVQIRLPQQAPHQ